MIDIVTAAETDPAEIAEFLNHVWSTQYPDEDHLAVWPKELFEWQFLGVPDRALATVIGARIDGTLVGVAGIDVWRLNHISVPSVKMSACSYFSVADIRPRARVAQALLRAVRQWSEERGSTTIFGFVNPETSGQDGRRFWTSRRDHQHVFPKKGPRQWHLSVPAADGPRTVPTPMGCHVEDEVVRALQRSLQSRMAMPGARTLDWSLDRLRHQLCPTGVGGVASRLDRQNFAVCSFYCLKTRAGDLNCYIDFLDASKGRDDLLGEVFGEVMAHLQQCGCSRVFTLGAPTNDEGWLKRLGFRPLFPSYAALVTGWQPPLPFGEDDALGMFFR